MHAPLNFYSLTGRSAGFWILLGGLALFAGLGGLSALYMEHNGHWVTGMTNQVVWGMPHVFAVFLVVAASGALNVASVGSVFGKTDYQPLGRLSVLLAGALLAGGLAVLVLDLGRSDRLMVAATFYNYTSIFCLNIALYSGFFGFVVAYLWVMMDPRVKRFYKPVAIGAFIWRLVLTTGTGSIFGLLASRSAYHSALMAPMFIALSLSLGLAMFNLVMIVLHYGTGRPSPAPELMRRLRILLAVLTAVSLYMVFMFHLTNSYWAERRDVEAFLLVNGGIYTQLLWGGFVVLGSLVPIGLLLNPGSQGSKPLLAFASLLISIGGVCLMYSIIIGGQVFPLEIFPGKVVTSSFFDGQINSYTPSLPEIFLGLGGVAIVGLVLVVGLWVLPLLPDSSHSAAE
jgi:molybdopterin-containing oxidoreductase family membrane subunit